MNENAPAPVEAPNPPPADAPPAAPPPAAPPPAADLVTRGVVRSERELALEAELEAARRETATERERLAQELLNQTRAKPDAKPVPPKVRKFGPLQILRGEED